MRSCASKLASETSSLSIANFVANVKSWWNLCLPINSSKNHELLILRRSQHGSYHCFIHQQLILISRLPIDLLIIFSSITSTSNYSFVRFLYQSIPNTPRARNDFIEKWNIHCLFIYWVFISIKHFTSFLRKIEFWIHNRRCFIIYLFKKMENWTRCRICV